jgi:hypothetical protein
VRLVFARKKPMVPIAAWYAVSAPHDLQRTSALPLVVSSRWWAT